MATVDIRNQASRALQGLKEGVSAGNVNPAIGAAVVKLFQNHLLRNPSNKQGWPTTGFWARAARATNYNLLADGVMVSVSQQGVRQRYYGGEIRPVNAKKLAIPARAEAYGKSPREFSNLAPLFRRVGGKVEMIALVEAASQAVSIGKRRKNGSRKVTPGAESGGAVMFWLVKSVRQLGDTSIIPDEDEIGDAAVEVVSQAVERAMRR